MDRDVAMMRLNQIVGQDIHQLAARYGVQVRNANGNVNKGWAGHVCEHFLGLTPNSTQSPDFGSWELKVIPLTRAWNGALGFKETMAITMINADDVSVTPFERSHLLAKLRRAVVVARIVGDTVDSPSTIHSVNPLELTGELYDVVRRDYEDVRACIRDPRRGFSALSGEMGTYVQPRAKGAGHGTNTRAFYARPLFLSRFIRL